MRRAPSKYHSRRTTVDGITFHSAKEARRWQDLRLLQKAGMIRKLRRQVVFALQTAPISDGAERNLVGLYLADFDYEERRDRDANVWELIVEDSKGYDTPLSKWKRKHVKAQYGIEVRLT